MQKSLNFKCFYPVISLQMNTCVASDGLSVFFFGFFITVLVLYWHKN